MPTPHSSLEADASTVSGADITLSYEMYGLRIRSGIPLGAPVASVTTAPDLTVRLSENPAASDFVHGGEELASLDFGEGRGYVFVRGRHEYRLAFHGVCDFRFSSDLRTVTVRLATGQSPESAGWLLRASVPALLLGLAGECMLHASAIESKGAAIAFAGDSGMGKSTLAARCCLAGHRLVTDDLLRLDLDAGLIACFPGGGEIRLREGASEMTDLAPDDRVGRSVDGRLVLNCDRASTSLPLAAVAIPRPAREQSRIKARRLSKAEALFCLSAWPRVTGWKIEEPRRAYFKNVGELVKRVPVCEVEMPWGPPFPAEFVPEILSAIERAGD